MQLAVFTAHASRGAPCPDRASGNASDRRKEFPLRLRDAAVVVLFSVSANPAIRPDNLDGGNGVLVAQTEPATLEGTTWQLTKLPGHQAADLAALPRRVTLRLAKGHATGFAGCNLLTGTYTNKGTTLTLKLGSTLMACPEPGSSIERTFLEMLKGPLSHAVSASRLTLTTASGAVLEFEPEPTMTLEGHTWNVNDYNNGRQAVVSLLPNTQITLSFEKGAVSGSAGCNTFRATSSVQGNRIKIGPAATTRMMCAEDVMGQERAFLKALESATRWAIEGGMLDMHRADDERVLTAKPANAK